MIEVKVTINTPALKKLEQVFSNDDVMKAWGVVYRSFLQRRFNTFSKGGGDWAPLTTLRKRNLKASLKRQNKANKTKATRLKRGSRDGEAAKQTILRDTGILFNALSPHLSGNGFESIQNHTKLIIGFSYGNHSGGHSISDIATFHQYGQGNNPKREIIVPPDEKTINKMIEMVTKQLK